MDADDSVRVKRAIDVPLLPSETAMSLMLTVGLTALAAAAVALASVLALAARSAPAPPANPVAKAPDENNDQQTTEPHEARARREKRRDIPET